MVDGTGSLMDEACLQHRLTAAEREQFEAQGFVVVPGVLPAAEIEPLEAAATRVDAEWRTRRGFERDARLNLRDAIGKDDAFLELIDRPQTIMKVVDILGWNIQLYLSALIVTPPESGANGGPPRRLDWHQDSGRLNVELEGNPRPRVSLQVGFFLSDASKPDRGNFHVVPGSHRRNQLAMPADEHLDPPDATPVRVHAGDAVIFDRRLWHAGGINRSSVTRRVLFLGYSYRWLRPRDDMTVAHYLPAADPIRRQLLGESESGGYGYSSPRPEDVPLRVWLAERVGADAVRLLGRRGATGLQPRRRLRRGLLLAMLAAIIGLALGIGIGRLL